MACRYQARQILGTGKVEKIEEHLNKCEEKAELESQSEYSVLPCRVNLTAISITDDMIIPNDKETEGDDEEELESGESSSDGPTPEAAR